MAFLKPIEARDTGIIAAYWRLTHAQLDCVAQLLDVQLHGYRDEAARRAGLAPVQRLAFRFATPTLEDSSAISMTDLYARIRATPDGLDEAGQPRAPLFADATDI
jgi:hypothetical protein